MPSSSEATGAAALAANQPPPRQGVCSPTEDQPQAGGPWGGSLGGQGTRGPGATLSLHMASALSDVFYNNESGRERARVGAGRRRGQQVFPSVPCRGKRLVCVGAGCFYFAILPGANGRRCPRYVREDCCDLRRGGGTTAGKPALSRHACHGTDVCVICVCLSFFSSRSSEA